MDLAQAAPRVIAIKRENITAQSHFYSSTFSLLFLTHIASLHSHLLHRGLQSPTCASTGCIQDDTRNAICRGGDCSQVDAVNPKCQGAGCNQDGASSPTCTGGGCSQVGATNPSCLGGGCDQSNATGNVSCKGGKCTGAAVSLDFEAFETMLLSTNRNPATCTSNCGCPPSDPGCTLAACTRNCKCQGGSCSMPKCTNNCKCQGGGCSMPKCTDNCKCNGGGQCDMSACTGRCKCARGGCDLPSEQEEFLMAMEQGRARGRNLRGAKSAESATN